MSQFQKVWPSSLILDQWSYPCAHHNLKAYILLAVIILYLSNFTYFYRTHTPIVVKVSLHISM